MHPVYVRATVCNLVFNEICKQVGKWWEDNEAAVGAVTAAKKRNGQFARRASATVAIDFLCFASASQQAGKSNLQKRQKIYTGRIPDMYGIQAGHRRDNRKNATRRQLWTTEKRPLVFPTVTPRQTKKQVGC